MEHRKKDAIISTFEEGAALQRYADSGDTLEVSFDKNDGTILYAEYFNNEAFMETVYYNYGTYWISERMKKRKRKAYADSQQATEKAHSSHKKQSKPLVHSSKSLTMTLLYSIHSVQT